MATPPHTRDGERHLACRVVLLVDGRARPPEQSRTAATRVALPVWLRRCSGQERAWTHASDDCDNSNHRWWLNPYTFTFREGGQMLAHGTSREDAFFRTLRLGLQRHGREMSLKDMQWMVELDDNGVWLELGHSPHCPRLSQGRYKDAIARYCPAGSVPGRLVYLRDALQHSAQQQASKFARGAAAATATAQRHVDEHVSGYGLGVGKVSERKAGAVATSMRRTPAQATKLAVPDAPAYPRAQTATLRNIQVFEPKRYDAERTARKRGCVTHPAAMRDRLDELLDTVPEENVIAERTLRAKLWMHARRGGRERYLGVASLLDVRGTHLVNAVYMREDIPNAYSRGGAVILVDFSFISAYHLEGLHLLSISNQVQERCVFCEMPEMLWRDTCRATPRTMLSLLKQWRAGQRGTPPRIALYLADNGMSEEVLGNIIVIPPTLHIVLGTEKPLLGALPAHVPRRDREDVLKQLRAVTHNDISSFSAEKLVANQTGAKIRAAMKAHRSLFRGTAATGMIRATFAVASELNKALYSPCRVSRAAICSYALVLWTFIAHLTPDTLTTLYPHELVAHLSDVALLPAPSIWLSDDLGESLMRFVVQSLRGGSHDWTLHTGQVLEWWRATRRNESLPGGGLPAREAPPPYSLHLPPCMFLIVAGMLGVWETAN
eukprot:gene10685-6780_t